MFPPIYILGNMQVFNWDITLMIPLQPDSWASAANDPEFELALYTMCFIRVKSSQWREESHIQLGPYNVNVKCYLLGNNRIGSVFPIAESWKPLSWWLLIKISLHCAELCIELWETMSCHASNIKGEWESISCANAKRYLFDFGKIQTR